MIQPMGARLEFSLSIHAIQICKNVHKSRREKKISVNKNIDWMNFEVYSGYFEAKMELF